MDNKIPDFGRGTVDRADKIISDFFRKTKRQPAVEVSTGDVGVLSRGFADLADAFDPEPSRKKWTVLVYMDGNNNLHGAIYDAMKQLEKVGSDRDVNIVVEIGGNPGAPSPGGITDLFGKDKIIETVQRYYVTRDASGAPQITSMKLDDLGEQDMGDPKVVSDFLEWGIRNYPAEHYGVIFFNHGAGFAGSLSDESKKSLVDTNEMKQVVEQAAKVAGHKIDLVNFDACLMAQAEVAHALKDSTSYMVSSEETERGSAQPIEKVMKDLEEGSRGKAMAPSDLAKLFVYEAFHQNMGDLFTTTLSAVDMDKMKGVTDAADRLAVELMKGTVDPALIRKNIKRSEYYCQDMRYKPYNDYRDLGHFAANISNDSHITDEKVKKAAQDVLAALDEAVIAVEHQRKGYKNATGLSTYLPANYGFDPKPETDSVNFNNSYRYEEIPYAKETHWDELMKYIAIDTPWHRLLKGLGMSGEKVESVDRLIAMGGMAGGMLAKVALFAFRWVARYEAWQAIRGNEAKGVMGSGPANALTYGMIGGGFKVISGIGGLIDARSDRAPGGITDILFSRRTKTVNAALNIGEGASMAVSNCGLLLGAPPVVSAVAGVLTFAFPAGKIIYDAVTVPRDLANKGKEMEKENPVDLMTVPEKLKDIEAKGGHFVR